jgi:hypothetical protein
MTRKKANSESSEKRDMEDPPRVEEKKTEKKKEEKKIMTDDEELLFSLNIIGSVKKDEKMVSKDNLLSIDDRWPFQNVRRWWSEDTRDKSANKVLVIITKTETRLLKLLQEERNTEHNRLIHKYFLALSKVKTGLENCRDTYHDQFTKSKFTLSIQKTEDLLNKLQNTDSFG